MTQYEQMSLEELRLEDYVTGCKGGGQTTCLEGITGYSGCVLGRGNQLGNYKPIKRNDTENKNGVTYNVDTLLHCITGMTQYEQMSLEELRLEDYVAGRKGGIFTQGTTCKGSFGGTNGGMFAGGHVTSLEGTTTSRLTDARGAFFVQLNTTLATYTYS